jgi:hypothetical protein
MAVLLIGEIGREFLRIGVDAAPREKA